MHTLVERLSWCWRTAAVLMLVAINARAPAQTQEASVTPNFRNTEVRQIAEAIGMISHKKFVIDPAVNATITVSGRQPLSVEEFYEAFLHILRTLGLNVRVSGNEVSVWRPSAGDSLGVDETPAAQPSHRQGVEFHITSTKEKSVEATKPLIQLSLSDRGIIKEYAPGNILIVADLRENIERIRANLGESNPIRAPAAKLATGGEPSDFTPYGETRLQPTMQGKGLIGFRFYPGRNSERFACLGLQMGDLLVAVDNVPLTDFSMSAFATIRQHVDALNEMGRQLGHRIVSKAVTLFIVRRNEQTQIIASRCLAMN